MAVKKTGESHLLTKALSSWEHCNDFLRSANEGQAKTLLDLEQLGKLRIQYLLRIHARFNKERAKRERSELLSSKLKQ